MEKDMCEMSEKDIQQIYDNRQDIAVVKTEVSHIVKVVEHIRDNCLDTLSSDIKVLNKKIDGLEKVQDKQSPFVGIFIEIVKTVIVGAVVAGMVVLGMNR